MSDRTRAYLEALRALQSDAARRGDGWVNEVAGLGTARDKSSAWRYQPGISLGSDYAGMTLLAQAFVEDDVVQAVASRAPEAMMRDGFEVRRGSEPVAAVNELLGGDRLGAVAEIRAAATWERLLGGGVVLIGAQDGRPKDEPLELASVTSLDFLRALDRRDVSPVSGRPGVYRLSFSGGSMLVHRSRLIMLRGRRLPDAEAQMRQGWGGGDVERAWDEIRDFHATWSAVRHLVVDGAQGVFQIEGLRDALGAGLEADLRARMEIIDRMRSVARALVLDKDESFSRHALQVGGYADLLEKAFERLAMAAQMPVVVLVGMSPAGLSATGESDIRLWYDRVAITRALSVEPETLRLARIAAAAVGEDPRGISVHWPSLWQETEREAADTRRTSADADKAEVEALQAQVSAGLLSYEEARDAWRRARGLDPWAETSPLGTARPGQPTRA